MRFTLSTRSHSGTREQDAINVQSSVNKCTFSNNFSKQVLAAVRLDSE